MPEDASHLPTTPADPGTAPPTPTPQTPTPPTKAWGFIDDITPDRIVGWAWNPANPAEFIDIELLDDDELLLTITANRPRQDLREAAIGDGNHGFVFENIGFLLPKSRHLLRLRAATTKAELPGSPHLLLRPETGLDAPAAAFITTALSAVAAHATDLTTIETALTLLLPRLADLINARHRLDPTATPAALVSRLHLTGQTHELLTNLLRTYPPLHLEPHPNPVVSIIIPVHGQFATTYDCLTAILTHLPHTSFEIIIVDDASRDETLFASLLFTGAIRTLRTQTNGGFVTACNAGAALARGSFLFFLNNDTLVGDIWLDPLVETFETLPRIGIVGARLLFPDGTLQEAGGIIWQRGDAWNWGRHGDPGEPKFNYLRDADYVSGAALMIRRTLFEQLNGFDTLFSPAYYEDTDLCFRVRAAGYRVVVQPAADITHLEGVSNGTDVAGTGLKRFQPINHRKFFRRWQATLAKHRMHAEHPELEAERFISKRAYFIDDTILTPDQDAGSNAALQHILALQRLGYKVSFIPAHNMERTDPFTRALEQRGIECLHAPYFSAVEDVLRKAIIAPDLVYCHRYANAAKYAPMVREKFPQCRLVYNVADVHFLREDREAELLNNPALRATAAAKRRRELAAMQLVDCVIVHSPVEAALLRELLPETPIETVGWTVPLRPTPLPFSARAGYGFLGGFRHPPNIDAVTHFVATILPTLPTLEGQGFSVIGSNMPPEITRLHGTHLQNGGIDIRGHVPHLADALNPLRCTIAPLRYGAGIKGKVLDSFAHGLPCLMSEIAAEGLPLEGDLLWLIARSEAAWAEKLTRLLTDEAWNTTLATAGLNMLRHTHNADITTNQLARAIQV